MPAPAWLTPYLQPGRNLVDVGGGVFSACSPGSGASQYDRQARTYDLLIGNRVYNRLIWGTSTASYAAFAAAAVDDGGGPLLDIGCGTAIFTADCYRATDRPLIMVDASVGMLARAAERLGGTERIAFVQADLFDLPFTPSAFETVSSHGFLHLFDDLDAVLRILRSHLAPGGALYATSLVSETRRAATVLRLLNRLGEAAAPRKRSGIEKIARAALGERVELDHEGSMTFLRWR